MPLNYIRGFNAFLYLTGHEETSHSYFHVFILPCFSVLFNGYLKLSEVPLMIIQKLHINGKNSGDFYASGAFFILIDHFYRTVLQWKDS